MAVADTEAVDEIEDGDPRAVDDLGTVGPTRLEDEDIGLEGGELPRHRVALPDRRLGHQFVTAQATGITRIRAQEAALEEPEIRCLAASGAEQTKPRLGPADLTERATPWSQHHCAQSAHRLTASAASANRQPIPDWRDA